MKLGAQLYSVRDQIQTPSSLLETLKKLAAQGYEAVQLSGASVEDAAELMKMSHEAGIGQICPDLPKEQIVENTEESIEMLKTMGCDALMIPYYYPGKGAEVEKVLADWAELEAALEKLQAAGITPAYHNHDFEFRALPGTDGTYMDFIMQRHPDWQYILDVCWVTQAKEDPLAWMERIGSHRLRYVHFKDMLAEKTEKGKPIFCPCGQGVVDLAACMEKAKELGVQYAIVEQDNATLMEDPFGQMQLSAQYMKTIL